MTCIRLSLPDMAAFCVSKLACMHCYAGTMMTRTGGQDHGTTTEIGKGEDQQAWHGSGCGALGTVRGELMD